MVGIDPFGRGRRGTLGGRGPGAEIVGVEGTHLDIVKVVSEAADDEGGAGGVLAHGRPTAATTTSVADVVTGEGGLAGVIGSGPGDRQRVGDAGDRHHDHIADGAGHGVRGGAVDVGRVAGAVGVDGGDAVVTGVAGGQPGVRVGGGGAVGVGGLVGPAGGAVGRDLDLVAGDGGAAGAARGAPGEVDRGAPAGRCREAGGGAGGGGGGGPPGPRKRPVAVALGVGGAHLHLMRRARHQARDGGAGAGDVLRAVGEIPAGARAVLQVVGGDGGTGVRRRGPGHVQAGGRSRRRRHRGRRRLPRGLVHVRDGDRHRDGVGAAVAVVGLDDDGMGGLGFVVVGHARPGADLSRAGDDVEGGRVGALQRVGQRVAVRVGGGQGGADVLARGRVLGHAAGRGVGGERRRVVGDNHGSGHLEDLREPVQGVVVEI